MGFIKEFLSNATHYSDKAVYNRLQANEEYVKLLKSAQQEMAALANILGDKDPHLALLDEIKNQLCAYCEEEYYRQGYQDCLALLNWIKE